jgi:long-chain acyl-CoA synthetase
MKWLARASLARDHSIGLGTLLERLVAVRPDTVLVEETGGLRLTVSEAADRVERMAGTIADQVKPGDRVVVATPNGYDQLLLSLAASRAGALAVPVNPHMTESEVDHVIDDSGAALVIRNSSEVLAGDVRLTQAVKVDPGDVAAIFYTSGTTGKPKGVRLTHRAILSQFALGALLPSGLRRDEVVVGLPVAHIMGFVVLLGLAFAGLPVFFLPKFRPDEALDAIESRRSSMFVGVPAMYRMMLEAGAAERDLRSIRVWGSGADVMPEELAQKFKKMGASVTLPFLNASVGEALFAEGYGMVETGGGVAYRVSPPNVKLPFGSFLFPLPPYRFRVVDDNGMDVALGQSGELWVHGPGSLESYHGDSEATRDVLTEEGWVRTGDLVRKGLGGLVSFEGRVKDVIKSGGYSIYANEVQRAIEEHPAVAEAAVVGIESEREGEIAVAALRLNEGGHIEEDELRDFLTQRLSKYKVPRQFTFVDEMPRTGTSKVKRQAIRDLFEKLPS